MLKPRGVFYSEVGQSRVVFWEMKGRVTSLEVVLFVYKDFWCVQGTRVLTHSHNPFDLRMKVSLSKFCSWNMIV